VNWSATPVAEKGFGDRPLLSASFLRVRNPTKTPVEAREPAMTTTTTFSDD